MRHYVCEKDYDQNYSVCVYEINKYLENYVYMKSHTDDSVITWDKILDAVAKSYEDTGETAKRQKLLLIVVTIC